MYVWQQSLVMSNVRDVRYDEQTFEGIMPPRTEIQFSSQNAKYTCSKF